MVSIEDDENTKTLSEHVRGAKRDAARRMWRVLVVVALNSLINLSLFLDIESAFLMSLVSCPSPSPTQHANGNNTCPLGSFLADAHCEPEPRSSWEWSFSSHCADKHRVMNQGKNMIANIGIVAHIGMFVAILLLGPLVDTWGRKPVIVLALCGSCAKSLLQSVASYMSVHNIAHFQTHQNILLAAIAIGSLTNNALPAARAMVADLAAPGADGRAAAFATLGFIVEISIVVGFAGGFFILKASLSDYTWVWVGSAIADVFIVVLAIGLLKETLVDQTQAEEPELSSASSDDVQCAPRPLERLKKTCSIFHDLMRDCVLAQMILLLCMLSLTLPAEHLSRQVLIAYLGYSQATASLLGVVLPAFLAAGNGLAGKFVRVLGAFRTLALSLVLNTIGLILTGLCLPFKEYQHVLFWSGQVLYCLGAGMRGPVTQAILSVRVDLEKQGMLFSLMHFVQIIGTMLGLAIFVKNLFNTDWTGWKAGTAYFVAAALTCMCMPWLHVIARLSKNDDAKESSSDCDSS